MPETALTYLQRGQSGIFAEVYFPRRIAVQGTIFGALEDGYQEVKVKKYLQKIADILLQELQGYQYIFDPLWYDVPSKRERKTTKEEAEARIARYMSPFFGWSNYVVDGVWFDDDGKPFEEATQVIRLMFRFDSRYVKEAVAAQCQDVLRAMLFWMITRQGRLDDIAPWDKIEQDRFIKEYEPMSKHKKQFAQDYFERVARETFKWMGDCFLFIFGYLVRKFAAKLIQRKKPEKEIWVTTFFNLTVSVMRKADQQILLTKGEP